MGLRTKAYFVGAFLTFFSSMAAALGLGEIKLNSSLNQPLDAEIQLLHLRGLTEREIIVGIASPAEFERAGVERNYFITELKFNIDLGAPGGPVVRVTSEALVREPFLNFIVTAQWPSGRLLREYTLLVDLPVFSGSQAAPVQAAPKAETPRPIARQPSQASQSTQSRPARVQPEAEPEATDYAADTYGPVGSNDTLWSIASRVKPDRSVSVQQTMLAIQRLNPEAFINNNINLLRRGQILRIPDKQEIEQLTAREAIREVAQQNNRWNNRSEEPEKAQLEGGKSFSQTRDESRAVEGRIKLSSPTSATQSGQGAGSENSEEGGVAQALAQTQEELDAADREHSDMKSRLQSMEEQIQTMEKLMAVSSEEMRALELAAQQTNEAEAAEETSSEPAVTSEEAPAASQPAAVEPVPEAKPVSPSAPVAPKKTWMDLAMDNILYIGAGAAALVLGLIALFLMRRRKDEFNDEFDDGLGDSSGEFAVADDLEFDQNDKTVPLFDTDAPMDDDLDGGRVLAEAETEDVVGECDIHIAYGQYDQAEEKLLRALEKDPSNVQVRLKLMEVFAAQGDGDNFDAHYARLHQVADTEALDRAALLRSSIEGIGEFDAAAHQESAYPASRSTAFIGDEEPDLTAADDTLNFDFDEVDGLVDSSAKTATNDMEALGDLDFDLHLDTDDITRIPEKSLKQPDEQTFDTDLADLEFELGDLDVDTNLDDSSLDLDLSDAPQKPQQPDDDLSFDFDAPELTADDLDADQGAQEDQFTPEFSDNLVAESAATDFSADLDDFADLTDDGETLISADNALDFDLDRDLESVNALTEETDAFAGGESESSLSELGLEDLQDLGAEDAGSSAVVSTAEAPADDFDMDFDLESNIDLDQLDQELDQLSSDFGSTSPAKALMDEPVVDFDDPEPLIEPRTDPSPEDQMLEEDVVIADAEPLKKTSNISNLSLKSAVPSEEAANSALDFEIPDFDPENDDDSNLDFLSDNDETATKLDLARAYIDMGDSDGAKDILDEILDEGNDQQKKEAEALLSRIG